MLIGATIDGEPLTTDSLLDYCELLVEAGNETDSKRDQRRGSCLLRASGGMGTPPQAGRAHAGRD